MYHERPYPLGRGYLQASSAVEIFRRNNVRFIAVSSAIDSENPDTLEFAPFINIISEWYAKDFSRKVKMGCMEFDIAKGRFSFRLTAPYSKERRKAAQRYSRENNAAGRIT